MPSGLTLSRVARGAAAWLLLCAMAHPANAQDGEWPGFRGRTGSGVVTDVLEVEGLSPRVVWRVKAGIGYSGVTVADGRAITMSEDDEQFMVAYDAATGEVLWRVRVADPHPGIDGAWAGPIATPVAHRDLVIGLEPWGRLFALDAATGAEIWSVHLVDDLGARSPAYGFSSSPLVVGDTLVVHGGAGAGSLLGFDVATGELRWTAGAGGVQSQSPVTLTIAGSNMVVAADQQNVMGVDATTGTVVWEYAHDGDGARGVLSLVPVGLDNDRIFLAHSGDASQVIGVRAVGEDMVAEQVWLERTIRNSYTVAVHHAGYIYAYSARILVCVDAGTGELQWRSRKPGDGFITVVGDQLVILTKDGNLHVVQASPEEFQEIASAPVFDELTWTPPSFAYGDVFARSRDELVRIDLHGGAAARVAEANHEILQSLDPGDGAFGRFVRAIGTAENPDRLIDEFFVEHAELPLIEGEDLVHFVYRGDDEVMSIAGDLIGSRNEAPMVRVGETDLFYFSARLIPDARVSYVFVRETETIPDPHNPLHAPTLLFDAEREYRSGDEQLDMSDLHMPRWEVPSHLRDSAPLSPRGTIETLTVSNERFGDVEFRVYLPAGYAGSAARYPVVYYHGPTPRELSAVPASLDNLIADGMPPVIAVFSEEWLAPNGRYVAMWAEQLVPAVDKTYRTIATAEGRVGVGGHSGARTAIIIAFAYPELTSGLGVHSLRALDTPWRAIAESFVPASERPLRVYMDWGVYAMRNPQEVWDNRAKAAERFRQFEDLGYAPAGGEVPDGVGWSSWRNRTDVLLEAILPPARE